MAEVDRISSFQRDDMSRAARRTREKGAGGGVSTSKRAASAKSKSVGRYDGSRSNTREVPGGRAQVNARLRTVQPVAAAVDDPYGGRERILVTVNRRTDVLETERSHGRISEGAYGAGQILQCVFERLGYAGVGAASLEGAGSGDPVKAVGDRVETMLKSAKACRDLMASVQSRLGMIDTRLLRRLLGDRMSFAECAAQVGRSGERGERYVGLRFRDALEDLAEAWAGKGSKREVPDDAYARRAEEVARKRLDRSGET